MTDAASNTRMPERDDVSDNGSNAGSGATDISASQSLSLQTDPANAGLLGDEPQDLPDGSGSPEVPASAEDYVISVDDVLGGMDADLNARLHAAGFSNDQAQLVYDLAGEILGPMMADMDQATRRAADRAALAQQFGGAAQWQKLAPRIEQWGRANLPDAAFDTLCQTRDGVLALHRMMTQAGETRLGQGGGDGDPSDLRSEIRAKMNDPRYWRDRDPALIAEVQAGFARLNNT